MSALSVEHLIRMRRNRGTVDVHLGTANVEEEPVVTPMYVIGSSFDFQTYDLKMVVQPREHSYEKKVEGLPRLVVDGVEVDQVYALNCRRQIHRWFTNAREMMLTYGIGLSVPTLGPGMIYDAFREMMERTARDTCTVYLLIACYWLQVWLLNRHIDRDTRSRLVRNLSMLLENDGLPFIEEAEFLQLTPHSDTFRGRIDGFIAEYTMTSPYTTGDAENRLRIRLFCDTRQRISELAEAAFIIAEFDTPDRVCFAVEMQMVTRGGRVTDVLVGQRAVSRGNVGVDLALLRVAYFVAHYGYLAWKANSQEFRPMIEIPLMGRTGFVPIDPTGRLIPASSVYELYQMMLRGHSRDGRLVDITRNPGTFARFVERYIDDGLESVL